MSDTEKTIEEALTPTAPVGFDKSPAKVVGGTLLGALLILATGFPTILGFFSARDILGFIRWLQGIEGASYIAAAGLVATLGWRVSAGIRKHLKALIAARAAPNSQAYVRGEGGPKT